MKEKDENSSDGNFSVKDKEITYDNIKEFRKVLKNKDHLSVRLTNFESIKININSNSYSKINKMLQTNPEENIVFYFKNKKLKNSCNSLSRSFRNRNSDSSFSSSLTIENDNNIKNEKINTDIKSPKIDNILNNNNNNILNNNFLNESDENNNETNEYSKNNNKNIQKLIINNNSEKKYQNLDININNRKFIIFKWIFHFYLIFGIILFFHFISFILSNYNDYSYKWLCIFLIIVLLYIGYVGIKNRISNDNYLLDKNRLFWANVLIFILTMINLIELALIGGNFKFIKEQGIIGYLMIIIYLMALYVEVVFVMYYDIIIKEITLERFDKYSIEEMNSNNLNIQLVDSN